VHDVIGGGDVDQIGVLLAHHDASRLQRTKLSGARLFARPLQRVVSRTHCECKTGSLQFSLCGQEKDT
jgi:hypothetical protein